MNVWERLLREYQQVTTFMGPDYTGARGGYDMPPQEDDEDFPYNKDGEGHGYGVPSRFMVGQGRDGGSETLHQPISAKHLKKSSWDVDEASGTPYMIGKSAGTGGSQGGLVAPGRLAGKPEKPWDEDDSEERAEKYGKDIAEVDTRYHVSFDPSVGWDDDVPDVGKAPESEPDDPDRMQTTIVKLANDPWGQATDRHVGYQWYQQEGRKRSAWDILMSIV